MEEKYSQYIICSFNKYSDDYPHLTKNWKFICNNLNVTPKKILLVDDIKFNGSNHLIYENLTKEGFVVRRKDEFIGCVYCGSAIPCQEIWKLLREKNLTNLKEWSNKCTKCNF
jgi:hypothetical protein